MGELEGLKVTQPSSPNNKPEDMIASTSQSPDSEMNTVPLGTSLPNIVTRLASAGLRHKGSFDLSEPYGHIFTNKYFFRSYDKPAGHCVRAVDDTTFQSMMERHYELLRKEHMKEIDDGKQRPAEETHSAPVEPVGNLAEKVNVQSHQEGMEILGSAYEQDFDQIAATKTAEQLTSTVSSQKMNTPAVLPRASTPQPQIPTQPISQTQQPLVSVSHHHNPYQQYSSANTQSSPHPQYSPYQQGFHQPYLQSAPQHSHFQPYPYHVQRHYHSPQHSTDNITAHQVIWMNDRFMTGSSWRDKLTD
uniref:Uncharacterized protein n=1 Tax=Timema douglasi TaxID=61478 RepID=A0A7R8VDT6_TIMDO|nr:unnamed protein product [Timema douglasi]